MALFFFIIAQGRWKQKPIRKSIRASHITYAATCYISTILLIQAFANYNGGLENIIKTFLLPTV